MERSKKKKDENKVNASLNTCRLHCQTFVVCKLGVFKICRGGANRFSKGGTLAEKILIVVQRLKLRGATK